MRRQVMGTAGTTLVALMVIMGGLSACEQNGPTVTTVRIPVATAARSYRYVLRASGGTPPYTWSAPAGGRDGVTVRSDGVLYGTPVDRERADIGRITVRVTDATGGATTTSFELHVQPVEALRGLNAINAARAAAGVAKVGTVTEISTLAAVHAADMARAGNLAGTDLLGEAPSCAKSTAELVGRGASAESVIESIMPGTDAGRRLLGPQWTRVGVGTSFRDDVVYVAIHLVKGC